MLGLRQAAGIVDHAGVTALERDDLAELFQRSARGDQLHPPAAGPHQRWPYAAGQEQHPRCQFEAQTSRRSAGPEPRITSMHSSTSSALPTLLPRRLVHVGDERHHLLAHAHAGLDHKFGQRGGRFFSVFMNAPLPVFTSSTRASMPSASFLLMMERRSGRAFDGGGDVAQGVKLLVGGRDLGGLADQRAAAGREHAPKFRQREIDVEAGNGFAACRGSRRCGRGRGR